MMVFAVVGFLVAAWSWIYKPKASDARKATYIQMMTPSATTQTSSELGPLEDTTSTKGRATHMIDMVRPANQYQSLKEDVTSSGTQ